MAYWFYVETAMKTGRPKIREKEQAMETVEQMVILKIICLGWAGIVSGAWRS